MKAAHPAEATLRERLAALPLSGKAALRRRIDRLSRRHGFFYQGRRSHPLGLVPVVLDPRTRHALSALTRLVFRFQSRAPRLYRDDSLGFADIIRLEPRTRAWFDAAAPRGPNEALLIRPDYGFGIRAGELRPWLYESNSLMLGSLYMQPAAQLIVASCLLPDAEAARQGLSPCDSSLDLLENWLRRLAVWKWARHRGNVFLTPRRRAGPRLRQGALALLEDLPARGGFSELPRIAAALRARGLDALHGDPRDLELRGGRVRLHGRPVAFAYRDFSFEDAGGPDHPRLAAFRRLWDEGLVVPGPAADFDQKGILECLSSPDFEPLFTKKDLRLLRAHVPWTRVLAARRTASPEGRRVDLPRFAIKNRERLVFKPSWGSGGEGLLIGVKTPSSRWERAVAKGLSKPGSAVVQEYVESPRYPTAFLRDGALSLQDCRRTVGVFHDGRDTAFASRINAREIVNVARGGAVAPVYLG